jgi:hypothetical protein
MPNIFEEYLAEDTCLLVAALVALLPSNPLGGGLFFFNFTVLWCPLCSLEFHWIEGRLWKECGEV